MRLFRLAKYGVIAVGLCALAGSAIAVSPVKKKLLPKPKLVAHAVVTRPVVVKPPPLARFKTIPKFAFRAPQPRLPSPSPARPVTLTAPAVPHVIDPAKPTLLAQSGDWSAFRASTGGGQTCFSATQPKDTVPKQQGRAAAYVYLTNSWPGGVKHELTIQLGLNAPASGVTANVDGHDFRLAASGGVAYPPDTGTQQAMLQAMRHGHTLILKTDLNGSGVVTDSFSLLGVEDALRATDYACIEPIVPR